MTRNLRRTLMAPLLGALLAQPGAPLLAIDFTVDSTADAHDAVPGNGSCATSGGACTLRAALDEANALAGDDTVGLPAGYYQLTLGSLYVSSTVAIQGAGLFLGSTIDANSGSQVFYVESTGKLTLNSMLLNKGRDQSMFYCGGAIYSAGELELTGVVIMNSHSDNDGGAVCAGKLTMTDCTLLNNTTSGSGGALRVVGHTLLTRVGLVQNQASSFGGALFADHAPYLYLTDCTVKDNTAGAGGGIASLDTDFVTFRSSITGNTASYGGGIYAESGNTVVERSTIALNTAYEDGGGLYFAGGSPGLVNTTVDDNTADGSGGGIGLRDGVTLSLSSVTISHNMSTIDSRAIDGRTGTASSVWPINTLIAANGPIQCFGISTFSLGNNLEPPGSTCLLPIDPRDIRADPLLGPLADNGGPTQTVALLAGSRGIDEGHSSASPIDQRGVARLDGNHDGTVLPDIGAFEFDDPIFRDGFESGDSSAWSATQPPS